VTLDTIDLLDRKFSRSLVGYCRDEVDCLVAEAAEAIGRLAEEKMALGRANDTLRREMAECRAREATLRDTLLTTQQLVEDLKITARQEVGRLLDEARGQAATVLETAREQAAALVAESRERVAALAAELDALAERKATFTARFRGMVRDALEIFDAPELGSADLEAVAAGAAAGERCRMKATAAGQAKTSDGPAVLDALDPFAMAAAGK